MANQKINLENSTMKEILIALRRLGGPVTRREISSDIRDNSTVISEQEVAKIKTSKNTGTKYRPFDYTLNYSVIYLIKTGFLVEDGHQVELTAKGRQVNLDAFNAEKDVRPFLEDNNIPELKNNLAEIDATKVSTDEDTKEDQWRQDLLSALMKMKPKKFELFCRGLLTKMGIDVDKIIGISYTADGGLDGFGYVRSNDYRTTRVALQAKRWHDNIPAPEIDKFRGAMDKYNAEFGIFITNSTFTRGAIRTARQGTRIITLIDGNEICDLVAKYNYYVEPVTTYRLKSFYTDPN